MFLPVQIILFASVMLYTSGSGKRLMDFLKNPKFFMMTYYITIYIADARRFFNLCAEGVADNVKESGVPADDRLGAESGEIAPSC